MAETAGRTFRLPRSAYLVVLFLTVGATALVQRPVLAIAYLVPVAAAVFIARAGTRVDAEGITVRALLGNQHVPWSRVRGVSVQDRYVYAVVEDGALRLPCVRIGDLAAVAEASGGRLPELPAAAAKYAPARRRR